MNAPTSPNDIRKRLERMTRKADMPRLIDIIAVDRQDGTFDLIYTFHHQNALVDERFVIKAEDELESIRDLYAAAVYMEREIIDMFGLHFQGLEGGFLLDKNSPQAPLRKPIKVETVKEVKPDA
jgi:NADH:ubiquinone oxidoreductase subunit C